MIPPSLMPTRVFGSARDESLDVTSDEAIRMLYLVDTVLERYTGLLVGKATIWQAMDHTRVTLPYHVVAGTLSNSTVDLLAKELQEVLGGDPLELVCQRLEAPQLDANTLSGGLSSVLASATFRQLVADLTSLKTSPLNKTSSLMTLMPSDHVSGLSKTTSTKGTGLTSYVPTGPSWNVSGSVAGLKVQLAGRLMTEPSTPRAIRQTYLAGSFLSDAS